MESTKRNFVIMLGHINKGIVHVTIDLKRHPFNNMNSDKEILEYLTTALNNDATVYTEQDFDILYDEYVDAQMQRDREDDDMNEVD